MVQESPYYWQNYTLVGNFPSVSCKDRVACEYCVASICLCAAKTFLHLLSLSEVWVWNACMVQETPEAELHKGGDFPSVSFKRVVFCACKRCCVANMCLCAANSAKTFLYLLWHSEVSVRKAKQNDTLGGFSCRVSCGRLTTSCSYEHTHCSALLFSPTCMCGEERRKRCNDVQNNDVQSNQNVTDTSGGSAAEGRWMGGRMHMLVKESESLRRKSQIH